MHKVPEYKIYFCRSDFMEYIETVHLTAHELYDYLRQALFLSDCDKIVANPTVQLDGCYKITIERTFT